MINRELDFCVKQLIDWTKEYIENKTNYIAYCFRYIYRDIWLLQSSEKYLASEKAYNDFFELTKKDIREFNWSNKVKINNKSVYVYSLFVAEHMTTANDFKNSLIDLYNKNKLNSTEVKKLIQKQQLCWITKEENIELNKHGFSKHRPDPDKAYEICGIKIKN